MQNELNYSGVIATLYKLNQCTLSLYLEQGFINFVDILHYTPELAILSGR